MTQIEKVNSEERYKNLLAEIESLRQQATNAGKVYFTERSQDIFRDFPEIESFSWTQYTPYWCDGDVCEFSVNSDYFDAKTVDGEVWDDVSSYYEHPKDSRYYRPKERQDELGDALSNMVSSVDEETMKEMFGDHVKVTVSRSGIEVEEYDHE